MGRMMHWESPHELNAFRLLDADPDVLKFAEQPLVVIYVLDGMKREHYPDVLIYWSNRTKALWEIKPEDKALDPEMVRRTALMARGLPAFGFSYQMVTAPELTTGLGLANALVLLRLGRGDIPNIERERIRRFMDSVGHITWKAVQGGVLGPRGPAYVCRLILEGALHVDGSMPLTGDTIIAGSGIGRHKLQGRN